MTNERAVIDAAVRSGLIDESAVVDPEGYDNGATLACLRKMAGLLHADEPKDALAKLAGLDPKTMAPDGALQVNRNKP